MKNEITNCAYCHKELQGNIIYDRVNNLAFCLDRRTSVSVNDGLEMKAFDLDIKSMKPWKRITSVTLSGCSEKYGMEKGIGIFPSLIPFSRLKEEIELSKIRQGRE